MTTNILIAETTPTETPKHCCPNHGNDSIQPVDHGNCPNHQQQQQTTTSTTKEAAPVAVKGSKDVDHNLAASFEVMGIGMLGIFIFMAIFFAMIKLMEKVFPHKAE